MKLAGKMSHETTTGANETRQKALWGIAAFGKPSVQIAGSRLGIG